MKTTKVKLNVDLNGLRKGTILNIGSKQLPMTSYWNRRIKDSKIDNCLTIIEDADEKDIKEKKAVNKPNKPNKSKIED